MFPIPNQQALAQRHQANILQFNKLQLTLKRVHNLICKHVKCLKLTGLSHLSLAIMTDVSIDS